MQTWGFFKALKYNQVLCHEDNQECNHEKKSIFPVLIPINAWWDSGLRIFSS